LIALNLSLNPRFARQRVKKKAGEAVEALKALETLNC